MRKKLGDSDMRKGRARDHHLGPVIELSRPGDEKGRRLGASEDFLIPTVDEKRDLSLFSFSQRVHAVDQDLVIANDSPPHQIRYLFQRV